MNERCEFCQYSKYRDKQSLLCTLERPDMKRIMIVQRCDMCKSFVREPGADDEVTK